ncbi:hypothetical protein CLV51_10894 [Chitinophaga niastensis]|uniref:Uncharacterized protein n=1 Tax=Chitinophaga niastensis TaxID=536980 RepID=A0A2P8HAZ9_CHINA|nr:hypothetical protein [Chitinophaga niastensis]PSL43405.1 hypothetical protein CLV51_10894 [Chitinophaga niastensis]
MSASLLLTSSDKDFAITVLFETLEIACEYASYMMTDNQFSEKEDFFRLQITGLSDYSNKEITSVYYVADPFKWEVVLCRLYWERRFENLQVQFSKPDDILKWKTIIFASKVARIVMFWRGLGIYLTSFFYGVKYTFSISKEGESPATTDTYKYN